LNFHNEYALFYSRSKEAQLGRLPRNEEQLARYGEKDNIGPFEWRNFRAQYSSESPKMVYPIYVKKDASGFRIPELEWNEKTRTYTILEEEQEDEDEFATFKVQQNLDNTISNDPAFAELEHYNPETDFPIPSFLKKDVDL